MNYFNKYFFLYNEDIHNLDTPRKKKSPVTLEIQ